MKSRSNRRSVLKGLGLGGAVAATAQVAQAATWVPISPAGQTGGPAWRKLTANTGTSNTWRKLGRQQVANCGGYLPNGYCASNPKYIPPNGTWQNWGLGFTASNPSGFTGTLTNCSTVTVTPIYDSRGDWNYCNCGTFAYINCNCNCACACNCTYCTYCSACGGFCCFPKGTQIRMPDGTSAPVEAVDIGTELAAFHGVSVVEDLIICVVEPGDYVYRVNGEVECTSEQLFLSPDGIWLAVSVDGYLAYRAHRRESTPDFGLTDSSFRQMEVGDRICTADGAAEVHALEMRKIEESERLHSFVVGGSKTFFANDFVVESRVSEACFDLSSL